MANILVVDADAEWFDRYESAVSAIGCGVKLAAGSIAAFIEMEVDRPDLVVVDLDTEDEGRQVLWLLEQLMPDMPVLLCSSGGDLRGAHFGGSPEFLHKFAEPWEIIGATARVLSRSHGSPQYEMDLASGREH